MRYSDWKSNAENKIAVSPKCNEKSNCNWNRFSEAGWHRTQYGLKYWYFEDEPKRKYAFTKSTQTKVCLLEIKKDISPYTKAIKQMSPFIQFMETENVLSPLPGTPKAGSQKQSPLPKTPTFVKDNDSPHVLLLRDKLAADNFLSPLRSSFGEDFSSQNIQSLSKTPTFIRNNDSPLV